MKTALAVACLALATLSSGCATDGGVTAGSSSPADVEHAMKARPELAALVGDWSGTNSLWLMPGDPVRESSSDATATLSPHGAILSVAYTWSSEDTPHEGVLLVRADAEPGPMPVAWFDSFHTGGAFMTFGPEADRDGLVAARGSYSAGSGPDWGWRIVLQAEGGGLQVLMDNITPDGQEMRAVAMEFTRP